MSMTFVITSIICNWRYKNHIISYMLETPHVMVGAAIATKVGNPYLAIPLAFLSHFVLDRIPHWNPHFYTESQKFGKPQKQSVTIAVIDEIIALGAGLYIAYQFLPDYKMVATIIACCFFAVLSDQIKYPFFFLKAKGGLLQKWTDWERSIQVEVSPFWGILTQILTIITAGYWIWA